MTESAGAVCYACCTIWAHTSSRDSHGYSKHGKPKSTFAVPPDDWDPATKLEDRRGHGRASRLKVFVPAPAPIFEPAVPLPWLAYPKTARECALVVGHCEASLKTIRASSEVTAFFESLTAQMRALGIQLRRKEEKARV